MRRMLAALAALPLAVSLAACSGEKAAEREAVAPESLTRTEPKACLLYKRQINILHEFMGTKTPQRDDLMAYVRNAQTLMSEMSTEVPAGEVSNAFAAVSNMIEWDMETDEPADESGLGMSLALASTECAKAVGDEWTTAPLE